MTGTKDGGKKFRDEVLAKDPDYYSRISRMARKPRGGKHSSGSFDQNPELAKKAGALGGKKSRRRTKGKRLATGVRKHSPRATKKGGKKQ